MTIDEIKKKAIPILRQHGVIRAAVFGSSARGDAKPYSDVDMLVDMNSSHDLLDFIGFKQELERGLGKKVDLVEYRALKSVIKDNILKSQVIIYEQ